MDHSSNRGGKFQILHKRNSEDFDRGREIDRVGEVGIRGARGRWCEVRKGVKRVMGSRERSARRKNF